MCILNYLYKTITYKISIACVNQFTITHLNELKKIWAKIIITNIIN